ncbi:MAG: hypothetical protein IPG53_05755 [Ignavibacteriales bacterium]|nr:hypothetical protein [Ignavibacteriales bacterium]
MDYRRPKYFKDYDHYYPYKPRVDGLIEWLKLPQKDDPDFLLFISMPLILTDTSLVQTLIV